MSVQDLVIIVSLQDDRTCWMEAIYAGSSAAFKPAAPESQYEPDTPVHSYAVISRSDLAQKRKHLRSRYEGPEIPQAHVSSQNKLNAKSKSRLHLRHSHQVKSRRPRPLPIIIDHEDIVPLHLVHAETVSHDEEPLNLYDDVADSLAGMEEYDTANGTQGDQNMKHRRELRGKIYETCKLLFTILTIYSMAYQDFLNSMAFRKQKPFSNKEGLEEILI